MSELIDEYERSIVFKGGLKIIIPLYMKQIRSVKIEYLTEQGEIVTEETETT
mgnify:CR=1 FL=1